MDLAIACTRFCSILIDTWRSEYIPKTPIYSDISQNFRLILYHVEVIWKQQIYPTEKIGDVDIHCDRYCCSRDRDRRRLFIL